MSAATTWTDDLRDALVALGVQPAEARRLAHDSEVEAAGADASARDLFGPAHLYARELVGALNVGLPALDGNGGGVVLLEVRDVAKSYRGRRVLDGVSFTARAGEIVAIVGPNGAGKSTLLQICAGTVRPSSGEVRRTGRMGYVPQEDGLVGKLTAAEHFDLVAPVSGRRAGRHAQPAASWRAGCRGVRPEIMRSTCPAGPARSSTSYSAHWATRSCCSSTSRTKASTRLRTPTYGDRSATGARRERPSSWSRTCSTSSMPSTTSST